MHRLQFCKLMIEAKREVLRAGPRPILIFMFLSFHFLLFVAPSLVFAQSTGTIAGRIGDAQTSEPLFGVTISVVGTTKGVATDFDGKYSLALEAGTYTIEVRSVGYNGQKIQNVVVAPKQVAYLSLNLKPETVEIAGVDIVGKAQKGTESQLLNDQRANNSVSSGVSAELLAKTPDRTMAESFRRISGTSIRDGRFAVVRGLNERYNQGQVNGMPQPSTEPDRKAFALDLFPSALIDKITVYKTATPDLPADFAGGLVKITTLDIPFSNSFTLTAAVEANTITTGKNYQTIDKSPTDWLGFDNGQREVPSGIFSQKEAGISRNLQEKAAQSQAFSNTHTPSSRTAAPNAYFQAFLGRRGLVKGRDVGMILGLNYFSTRQYTNFLSFFPYQTIDSTGLAGVSDFDSTQQNRYKSSTTLSGIANFSVKPNAKSKLSFRNLLVQAGVNQTFIGLGKTLSANGTVVDERKTNLSFYEQSRLLSQQLGYERFINTNGAKLDLLVGYTNLFRTTPDFKRLIYTRAGQVGTPITAPFVASINNVGDLFNPGFSGKFFSNLKEQSYSAGSNITLPFQIIKIKNQFKAGALFSHRERTFQGRNFLYTLGENNFTPEEGARRPETEGPDSIFRNENLAGGYFYLQETTRTSDFYSAFVDQQAGYLMNETYIGSGTRIIYGARLENYTQSIFSASQKEVATRKTTTVLDLLPSINANFNLSENLILRAAYFITINRPELRELSPFNFYDPALNATIYGNNELKRAKINNQDIKLEYYPNDGQVFSINYFRKRFDGPIEQARVNTSAFPTFTFVNAYSAATDGLELELRADLRLLDRLTNSAGTAFQNLTLFGNAAFMKSNVVVVRGQKNYDRPLQGQSPYIFNGGLSYALPSISSDITFTANRIGTRIAFVGDDYASSLWERPRTILDLAITTKWRNWNLKAIAGDLLAQELIQFYIGDEKLSNEKKGIAKFFANNIANTPTYQKDKDIPFYRFSYGRTIRLSASYTF